MGSSIGTELARTINLNMTLVRNIVLFIATSIFLVFAACNDPVDDGCYDAGLAQSMRDSVCILTCEGVCACNGRTYCNECDAMKAGYTVAAGDTVPCPQ